jgi:hypothetical protein
MVRPVSFKGFQKGFQGVSLRGFRGFQIFLRKLCVCIKYLSLGDAKLPFSIQALYNKNRENAAEKILLCIRKPPLPQPGQTNH